MAKLEWDKTGERLYDTGVDRGVLYVMDQAGVYGAGVAWNGLTTVTESPSGAESNKQYADNMVYLNLLSAEDFGGTIEALTFPNEFGVCDGSADIAAGVSASQQPRRVFGFSYRTKIGNDINSELGYKIHLVYQALAAPSEQEHATINDSPEPLTFSWEFSTTPVPVTGFKPTSHLTINSTKTTTAKMASLEDLLYGTASVAAKLPTPAEVITLMGPVV